VVNVGDIEWDGCCYHCGDGSGMRVEWQTVGGLLEDLIRESVTFTHSPHLR